MKKLYIVLIALFTFLTLPGLQTQAFDYPYSSNDVAIAELNGSTLNEIFVDNNLIGIDNNDILKNSVGWSPTASLTITIIYYLDLSTSLSYVIPATNNDISNVKVKIGNIDFITVNRTDLGTNDIENTFGIGAGGALNFRVNQSTYPNSSAFESYLQANDVRIVYESIDSNSNSNVYINLFDEIQLDKIDLGITSLTNQEIENYYKNWLYNYTLSLNPTFSDGYSSGFDTGYTTGYNDGYGDAVEEDNAYSLGYALGLSEGQDMETGSSIIVLVLAALSFAFMLFGFMSKKRIFNLFASGLFIVLGGLLIEYPAFIIVTIGFVLVNLYYTFVSD